MPVSRRKFLQNGSLVALAAGIPLANYGLVSANESGSHALNSAPGLAALSEKQLAAMSRLTQATFSKHLNTTFRFRGQNSAAVVLKLIEVKEFAPVPTERAAMSRKECFSAIFSGPADQPLTQNTYAVDHGELGSFDLFVVPVGGSKKGTKYEAVFNHRCS